ncbi:H+/Cl- antiporter ClcA [Staphylococcus hominis]
MIPVIRQFISFFVILVTYGLIHRGYMNISWDILIIMCGIFFGFFIMFYFSVYKSPEFSKRKIKIIAYISSMLTIVIIFIQGHLTWILLTK